MSRANATPLFDPTLVRRAAVDALRKLDPRRQIRNPVTFVVLIGSVLATLLFLQALAGHGEAPPAFIGAQDPHLSVREVRAEAVVRAAAAEGDVRIRIAREVEALGRGERGRVAVRRRASPSATSTRAGSSSG